MPRVIGQLVACLVLITSFGGGGAETATSDPATSESPTTAAAAEVDAASPSVVPVDVPPCDLLTADEVATATGLPAEQGQADGPIGCMFDLGDDAGVSIFVVVDDGQGRMSGPATLFEEYTDLGEQSIPDLGEAAVYSQTYRSIAVDAGTGRFIGIGVHGGYAELAEPREILIELADLALGRL